MNNQGYRFARLLWLYGEIVSKGAITFQQISESWANSSLNRTGSPLSHKTFENHRKDVEDLFGINIECNRADNTYYVLSQPNFSKAACDMLNGALLFNNLRYNPQTRAVAVLFNLLYLSKYFFAFSIGVMVLSRGIVISSFV